MKLGKLIFSALVLLLVATGVVVYTASCEKDPCRNVSCKNGGSCNGGACVCLPGYEGATCAARVTDRFVGYYAGFTSCNMGAQIIDTVFITADVPKKITTLRIIQKSWPKDTLYGVVASNESTYAINIPDKVEPKHTKKYHVTLQSDKSLTLYTYEVDTRTPGDSIVTQCNFVGFKGK